jgi:hypothetical protein
LTSFIVEIFERSTESIGVTPITGYGNQNSDLYSRKLKSLSMANFNGSAGGPIPLATAKQWTANYRATIKPGETEAHYFGADSINRVLNEDRSVGLRIYYAIDDNGKKQLLLVGVDAEGNNLLPAEGTSAKSTQDDGGPIIVDHSMPCPPACSNPPL